MSHVTHTIESWHSKSLEWSNTYEEAINNLLKGTTRQVDVGHVLMGHGTPNEVGRHFINISSCGSSALIAQVDAERENDREETRELVTRIHHIQIPI